MDIIGSWSNEIQFMKEKGTDDPDFKLKLDYRLYFFIRFYFESKNPSHLILAS